jgi:hypothetical protein
MRNRVSELRVPLMTPDEIGQILRNGERLMNVDVDALIDDITRYALGVASICHQLALNACVIKGIEVPTVQLVPFTAGDLAPVVEQYVAQSSDSLKAVFEKALLRHRRGKYDNCSLILRALATGPLEGMFLADILSVIRQSEPAYPASNLGNYLTELIGDGRGPILRHTSGGRFRFIEPLHHTFAQLTLLPGKDLAESQDKITSLSADFLTLALSDFTIGVDILPAGTYSRILTDIHLGRDRGTPETSKAEAPRRRRRQ